MDIDNTNTLHNGLETKSYETKSYETKSYETKSYETKAGIPLDAMVTHAEMMRAFDVFKETNDQRLALSEKRAGSILSRPLRTIADFTAVGVRLPGS